MPACIGSRRRTVTYVSPRAHTEKAVSASLGAELADSQSQNSQASLGGTPSPCMHSFHGSMLSSTSPLLPLHQGFVCLPIRMMTPQSPPEDARSSGEISDARMPHGICAQLHAAMLPSNFPRR